MVSHIVYDCETLGLDMWRGRILSIVAKDIDTGETYIFAGKDEKWVLQNFWDSFDSVILIGFNNNDFDDCVLIKRSLICNIKMKPILKSIDLRKIVNGFWYSYRKDVPGKLSDWARVLHIPIKSESGSKVFGLYKKNDWYSIIFHNIEDVEVTYQLYLRCFNSNLIK